MADEWISLADAFNFVLLIMQDEELADLKLSRALWAGKIRAVARTAIVDDTQEQENTPLPTIAEWHGWPDESPVTYYWRTSRALSPNGRRKVISGQPSFEYYRTMYYVVKVSLQDILSIWPEIAAKRSELIKSVGIPNSGAPGRPSSISLVEEELDRRISKGEKHKNNVEWARILEEWLKKTHPHAHNLTSKTIINNKGLSKKMRATRSPEPTKKFPK
ncbi:hypothetical protein ACLBXB_04165 [Methylobacterium mesophilicum]